MRVEINRDPKLSRIDNLFVLLTETTGKRKLNVDPDLAKLITRNIDDSGFSGRSEETLTILAKEPKRITLVGLGKAEKLTQRAVRAAIYAVGKHARKNRQSNIAVLFPYEVPGLDSLESTRMLLDLLAHSDYKYDAWRSQSPDEPAPVEIRCTLVSSSNIDDREAKRVANEAAILADSVRIVRDLGNGPGNEVTPERIAQKAMEVSKSAGFKCTVYDKRQIEKMKMGGLLAVNSGSDKEPRFIVMEHAPRGYGKTICVVGKGITFDSGGISIKPSDRMEEMKFDMCGAAAVIGIMAAVSRLKIPHRVIGLVPSTENLPSGSAYKPGDIIRMMSGKTVEVVNTDAEGRMILADALHYASNQKPDHIIDFATLTGACVVALGNEATGLFSNDDELARKLIQSGERVGERLWRLPEWDEYKEYIRSEWADMKNSGGRWGGAITAAVFLKEFVDCPSWAHLDIAGTANTEHETSREVRGATGVGVRLVVDFLESLS